MYSMDDLLELASAEKAEELKLHVGKPPIIVVRGEDHLVEGPTITAENAKQLLLSVADTRRIREIRENGAAEFIYAFRGSLRFLVVVKTEEESIGLVLQLLAA